MTVQEQLGAIEAKLERGWELLRELQDLQTKHNRMRADRCRRSGERALRLTVHRTSRLVFEARYD